MNTVTQDQIALLRDLIAEAEEEGIPLYLRRYKDMFISIGSAYKSDLPYLFSELFSESGNFDTSVVQRIPSWDMAVKVYSALKDESTNLYNVGDPANLRRFVVVAKSAEEALKIARSYFRARSKITAVQPLDRYHIRSSSIVIA